MKEPKEERFARLRAHEGLSVAEAASAVGISRSTGYAWDKRARGALMTRHAHVRELAQAAQQLTDDEWRQVAAIRQGEEPVERDPMIELFYSKARKLDELERHELVRSMVKACRDLTESIDGAELRRQLKEELRELDELEALLDDDDDDSDDLDDGSQVDGEGVFRPRPLPRLN